MDPGAIITADYVRRRRTAIELRAAGEGLTLQDVYVEDIPGQQRMLVRLLAVACCYLIVGERCDVVVIFEPADLGRTAAAQSRSRQRVVDLGLRLEIIQ